MQWRCFKVQFRLALLAFILISAWPILLIYKGAFICYNFQSRVQVCTSLRESNYLWSHQTPSFVIVVCVNRPSATAVNYDGHDGWWYTRPKSLNWAVLIYKDLSVIFPHTTSPNVNTSFLFTWLEQMQYFPGMHSKFPSRIAKLPSRMV